MFEFQADYAIYSILLACGLFVAMLGALLVGLRYGGNRHDNHEHEAGVSVVNSAVFGLLGLVIAFVFSGAAARYDERRDLIVNEANSISSTWLLIDVLPVQHQPVLRHLMREYTEARLDAYRALPDEAEFAKVFAHSERLQAEIWAKAVIVTNAPGVSTIPAMLLLPALNDMFAVTTTREMALRKHPPTIVYVLLAGLALASSVLAGHAMADRQRPSLLHLVAYPTVISIVFNLVINLEHPRFGLVSISAFDTAIENVLRSMTD